ncbi:MAG: IMP dehydrogenase, partial [Candidatus Omnitrophica bacterium]|nr:IMP dehydrogenase [Candidatus Omnitrophota bacterium]
MAEWIGIGRRARRCYGFDEIALVPGMLTINPNEVATTWTLGGVDFEVPILAAAMDGVVDVGFAVAMGKLGGIAVLNLDGVQTRYDNPSEVLAQIASAAPEEATKLVQSVYTKKVKESLIAKRVEEIKSHNVPAIVSCIPQNALKYSEIAQEAGCDIFVVQSTVAAVKHVATEYKVIDLEKLFRESKIPMVIGNCVTYEMATELINIGVSGLLVGIGPGAACTTRGVLGIGVPQITSTVDCSAARDHHYKRTGDYIPIITDGGMR